jgi:GDPmannose 4,6-dehydratase
MNTAIITGITGQTGSYMAELLLKEGFKVVGLVRRTSKINTENINNILLKYNDKQLFIEEGDLTDYVSTTELIKKYKPKFLFNFAAQSHVHVSWKQPVNTFLTNTNSVLNLLEGVRLYSPDTIFYQASTSEMFGDVVTMPQNEYHPLRPRSVYGASKVAAHSLVKVYRESYGLEAYCGILYNHESPRRHESFVTRKITKAVVKISKELKRGLTPTPLILGNLDSKRDWSHAFDMCQGIWLMVNSGRNKDYVLASGETKTIREFLELAFNFSDVSYIDVNPEKLEPAMGENNLQINYTHPKGDRPLVLSSREFYRPAEVDILLGDPSLAIKELGWHRAYNFTDLVSEMILYDTRNG